jgi:hypothetical protein
LGTLTRRVPISPSYLTSLFFPFRFTQTSKKTEKHAPPRLFSKIYAPLERFPLCTLKALADDSRIINGRRWRFTLLLCCGLISTGLSAPDPGKKSLEAFFGALRQQSISGNSTELLKLAKSTFPNRNSIKKGLSDHAPDSSIEKLVQWYAGALASSDEDFLRFFNFTSTQSEITAYPATVEDLISNLKDSTACLHFPRGVHPFAHDSTLRDDTTYYEVLINEPGKATSHRFDLLYWDGEAWKMLGGIWSVLQAEDPLIAPSLGASAEAQRQHLKELKERLTLYQQSAKKAEADLATAMAGVKDNLDPDTLADLINRSLEASKLSLAMQTKIPKMEERIKRQNVTVAMLDIDFGKLTGFDQILPAAPPQQPASSANDQLALLKRELRFLGIAKSGTAKALANPSSLTREELIKLTSELLEVDQLMAAKQKQIDTLEAELASKK